MVKVIILMYRCFLWFIILLHYLSIFAQLNDNLTIACHKNYVSLANICNGKTFDKAVKTKIFKHGKKEKNARRYS